MKAKSVLYAAVGGPVVVARRVSERASDLGSKISEQAGGYSESFEKTIESWAAEGEKVVVRMKDGKVVEEITAKVDLDQAKEQVSKLRDQLEDMLATWRTSFRPEKAEGKADTKTETAKKPAAKKPAAKKPAAKKPAAKTTPKTSTAETTESEAAKKSSEKPEAGEPAEMAS